MWQLRIICIAFVAIYAQKVTAKTLSTIKSDSIEENNVTIVGGHDIDIKDAPFQVSVERFLSHYCGGSIIAKDIILTAAHCLCGEYGGLPKDYQIRVGSKFRESGGLEIPVANFTCHPNFNNVPHDYDVALIKLETPLEFNDTMKPIDMMGDGENIDDGALLNVTGWGDTREGGIESVILQQVSVHKVNEEVCRSDYSKRDIGPSITPRMLCAGEPGGGKDSCQGDSGGPLVFNGKLAGIVSWGAGCAKPNYPGVYSKVSALRTWIDDSIKHLTSQNDSDN